MTNYSTEYLEKLKISVEAFEIAFEAWMATQVELNHWKARGLLPTVWVKEGSDPVEVQRLELAVAEAAGLASTAVKVTGRYIMVQGLGTINPIESWATMSEPKALLSPKDVRIAAAAVRGQLQALIVDAEAHAADQLPSFSPALMHEVVWNGAAAHWTIHQYRVAVREAAEALTAHWKKKLGRNDIDGTQFWQETLSGGEAKVDRPKLRWPDADDKTSKSIQSGLEPLAKSLNGLATGLTLTVRNVTTHTLEEISVQEAMERLAAYSFLARLLDQCEVDKIEP
mgnify:FL=1